MFATYDNNTYIENFECHVLPGIKRNERWLEHISQPIRSGLFVGGRIEHYYDISHTKILQDQIIRSERLAATGQLAASVAHEINSPLQAITMLLGTMRKENEENKELLDNIVLLKGAFYNIRDTVKNLMDLCTRGSIAALTIKGFENTIGHSLKSRLLVMMVECFS